MLKKQDRSKVCCCRNYNCIDGDTGCSFKSSICSVYINVSSININFFVVYKATIVLQKGGTVVLLNTINIIFCNL